MIRRSGRLGWPQARAWLWWNRGGRLANCAARWSVRRHFKNQRGVQGQANPHSELHHTATRQTGLKLLSPLKGFGAAPRADLAVLASGRDELSLLPSTTPAPRGRLHGLAASCASRTNDDAFLSTVHERTEARQTSSPRHK